MKNYKMRLESVASRLDFDERRARALNGRGPDTVSAPGPVAVATPAGSTEGRRQGHVGGRRHRPATTAPTPGPTPPTRRDERHPDGQQRSRPTRKLWLGRTRDNTPCA